MDGHPIGTVPTQSDFSDYRDMSGVKLPFKMLTTWTDGQTTIQLTDVRLNVPIEPRNLPSRRRR